jgi:hypothetical protein
MIPAIVVKGTKDEVEAELRKHKLCLPPKELYGEPTENPPGFPAPSMRCLVHKVKPVENPFVIDILREWEEEPQTSLLDY